MSASSVYAAGWRALHRLLGAASFHRDMVTTAGIGVDGKATHGVFFGGFPNGTQPVEFVLVVSETLDMLNETEATFGDSADLERVQLRVEVATARPSKTPWQALERLEELTGIVEDVIDANASRSSPPTELAPFGAWWERNGSNRRGIAPMESGSGYLGYANVLIDVTANQLRS